jgi:hypothetical protein
LRANQARRGFGARTIAVDGANLLDRNVGEVRQHGRAVAPLEACRSEESKLMLSMLQSARAIRRATTGVAAGNRFHCSDGDGANDRTDLAKLGLAVALAMTAAVLAMIVGRNWYVRRWHTSATGAMQRRLRLSQQQERCCPNDGDGQALFACTHDEADPKS